MTNDPIQLIHDTLPPLDQTLRLYQDADWRAYTRDPEYLMRAIAGSRTVITAWDGDELVGLIRAVGDGISILYVQDLLVLRSHQRRGIGTRLMHALFDQYEEVRQKVLSTDVSSTTDAFYRSCGMQPLADYGSTSYGIFRFA
ncbi:GNAT family acetyltransferase [Bifidobacterium ramosum]|uniref:GNAT family N-acetyltransferase n=1 Tax=Bifidobacterium ramosum TaxID=1798158 RepID=A0A6L4X1N0_9BIFI|nr:GNAT family N-acetyltransferase [Bifidobacterium ramosum]KAB8288809.1 GNAT family acetyltransferase [Bifidobacterium ramosum]NEG71328.1 GNAT family N-acetyltransferase [Bifidobacterium ramosum]